MMSSIPWPLGATLFSPNCCVNVKSNGIALSMNYLDEGNAYIYRM